jgi:hypothetical protein
VKRGSGGRRRLLWGLCAGVLSGATLADASAARADESIIKHPGDHPSYRFEAEPHGLLGYGGPFGAASASLGAGFRGTIIFLDNGFVPSINNSVGIGFGGDIFFTHGVFFIPIVLQWNFWLSSQWSVFGEPGIGFAANPEGNHSAVNPALYAGARFHFNDKVALTLRIGYPSLSVGASFFF